MAVNSLTVFSYFAILMRLTKFATSIDKITPMINKTAVTSSRFVPVLFKIRLAIPLLSISLVLLEPDLQHHFVIVFVQMQVHLTIKCQNNSDY